MDESQLLNRSLSIIKKSCTVSSESVPETAGRQRRRSIDEDTREAEELKKMRMSVAKNLSRIADVASQEFIQNRVDKCLARVEKYEDDLFDSDISDERRAILKKRLLAAQSE